jgi:agmatinase
MQYVKLIPFIVAGVSCRQVVFPPAIGFDWVNAEVTTPGLGGMAIPFAGLSTYAHLPYVHCLADVSNSKVEKFDIAVLGAPFDTVRCRISHVLRNDSDAQ